MSRRAEETRARILEVTRRLLEEKRGGVAMSHVAHAAGVTRQLLYLHFESRSHLVLEVMRAVDAEVRPAALQASVDDAGDAREALRRSVAVQGQIKPRIDGLVSAVDSGRAHDPALASAWHEREEARLGRLITVAARLQRESLLRGEWSPATAARMAWAATSQHSWQALVRDGEWSTDQWVEHTSTMLDLALCYETASR